MVFGQVSKVRHSTTLVLQVLTPNQPRRQLVLGSCGIRAFHKDHPNAVLQGCKDTFVPRGRGHTPDYREAGLTWVRACSLSGGNVGVSPQRPGGGRSMAGMA